MKCVCVCVRARAHIHTHVNIHIFFFRRYDDVREALSPYGEFSSIGKDTGREGIGIPELIVRDKVVVTLTTV